MRRRRFIVLLGTAATMSWQRPLAAQVQPPAMPTIGYLHAADRDSFGSRTSAFRDGLRTSGYVEGQNVAIEYRWAEGRFDKLPELAADLVARRVALIATPGNTAAALAAKAATSTIPIVFGIPDDPVKFGLVASLARPGGNATGVNFLAADLVGKRLELIRELVPKARRVAVLVNPLNHTNADATMRDAEAAARVLGLEVRIHRASTSDEIDLAFASLALDPADALLVGPDAFFNSWRAQLARLAARRAIPAIYSVRNYVEAGGLISYGPSLSEVFRRVGVYAGRILKGTDPRELPVEQPTALELIVNLNTARSLGIEISPSVLARADEVIE